MKKLLSVTFAAAAILLASHTAILAEPGCMQEVCLKVVHQRAMTDSDIKRITLLSLRRSIIRFRLSNKSDHDITYLTWLDSVEPVGFRLSRSGTGGDFSSLPKADKRTESTLKSGRGETFRYLKLSPNSILEFELPDWGNPNHDTEHTEHAFSTFIKAGSDDTQGAPVELFSELFKPLRSAQDLKILSEGKAVQAGGNRDAGEASFVFGEHPSYSPERSKSTPFRYVIVMGTSEIERYINQSGNTDIEVLMEDKAFNEKNLIILFNLLSSRFTEKPGLSVNVFTSLDAILTPEENDGLGLKGPVADYEKFKYAFFNRNGYGEYFRYGIPGKVKDKRVVMKEPPKDK